MTFSRQLARDILDVFVGKTPAGGLQTNATVYLGLSTTTPTESGGGVTEPSGNGYSRVAIATNDWTAATNTDPARISNTGTVTFPQANGGNWGLMLHAVFYDSLNNGAFLGSGIINGGAGLQIDDADTAEFQAGDLAVTLT